MMTRVRNRDQPFMDDVAREAIASLAKTYLRKHSLEYVLVNTLFEMGPLRIILVQPRLLLTLLVGLVSNICTTSTLSMRIMSRTFVMHGLA